MDLVNGKFVENAKIVLGGLTLLNTTGLAGDYVSLKGHAKLAVILGFAPASGTDVSAVTVKQAKTVDGLPNMVDTDTEKALDFTRVYKNGDALASDALVETGVTAGTFNTSALAALELFVIEIDENDLDVNNGFDCVRVNATAPGAVSTPAFAAYVLYDAKQTSQDEGEELMIASGSFTPHLYDPNTLEEVVPVSGTAGTIFWQRNGKVVTLQYKQDPDVVFGEGVTGDVEIGVPSDFTPNIPDGYYFFFASMGAGDTYLYRNYDALGVAVYVSGFFNAAPGYSNFVMTYIIV